MSYLQVFEKNLVHFSETCPFWTVLRCKFIDETVWYYKVEYD